MYITYVSDTLIELEWIPPTPIGDVQFFFATTNGADPKTCEVPSDVTNCTISGLTPYNPYEVSVFACNAKVGTAGRTCSNPPMKTYPFTLPAGTSTRFPINQ